MRKGGHSYLDFTINRNEVRRLTTDSSAILLLHILFAANDNVSGTLVFGHRDLLNVVAEHQAF